MRPDRPLALAFVLLAACGAPSTAPTSGARPAAEMPRTAAAPPAPAAAPSFEGVVRGPDGKPIVGAVVAVFGETNEARATRCRDRTVGAGPAARAAPRRPWPRGRRSPARACRAAHT